MSRIPALLVCLVTAATGLFAQAAPPLLARDPVVIDKAALDKLK